MAGLLDALGLQNSLGSGGLLGSLNNAYGGEDRLRGLLLTLGGHEQAGAMLMQQAAQRDAGNQFGREFGSMYGGGQPQQAGAPMAPAGLPMPGLRAPSTTGKIYGNDEPSPLDPPSGQDRDLAIRTMLAEAGNQGPQGLNAVGSVIRNRAVAGNFGGDTPSGVVQSPNQFEPWNTPGGRSSMAAIDPNSPRYQQADQALTSAYAGNDPTMGATHFFAPKAQAALGRDVPSWGRSGGQDIGDHRFFGGAAGPQQVASAGGGLPAPQTTQIAEGQQPTQVAQAPQAQQQGAQSPKIMGLMRLLSIPNLPDGQRKLAETLLAEELKRGSPTDDIREFEYAKGQGFHGTLQDWMQRKRSGAGEYGLSPIWGTGQDGKPGILQLGKSGEAIQSKLPEGFQVGKDALKIDAGTHTVLLDPVTRQQIGIIPKNIEAKAVAEKVGEAQGAAKVGLPNALVKAGQSLELLDAMIAHPGRETATGLSGKLDPRNYVAGTDATNFRVRQEQMQGRTFLEAFESLKGAGAITEMEGAKATQAIARLNTAQSDTEYLAALNELKGIITKGMEVARQKAAGNFSDPAGWNDMGGGIRIREKK